MLFYTDAIGKGGFRRTGPFSTGRGGLFTPSDGIFYGFRGRTVRELCFRDGDGSDRVYTDPVDCPWQQHAAADG